SLGCGAPRVGAGASTLVFVAESLWDSYRRRLQKLVASPSVALFEFLISLRRQRRVPVFPDWLVAEAADERGDFLRRAAVGDVELAGRVGGSFGRRSPFTRAGGQFHDAAAFGLVDFLAARARVAAGFGVAAGAHERNAERD